MVSAVAAGACASGVGRAGAPASGAPASGAPAVSTVSHAAYPGLGAITEADLRGDLFAMAGDAMRGREAGTLDELRAAGWIADAARAAGLSPAGDDGTFFQWWPMRRTRLSEESKIRVGDQSFTLWKDAVVTGTADAAIDEPIVFAANVNATELAAMDLHDKVVAFEAPALTKPAPALYTIRNNTLTAVNAELRPLTQAASRAGARAVIIVMNAAPAFDTAFTWNATTASRGTYAIDSAGAPAGSYARPAGANGQNAGGRGAGNGGANAPGGRGRGGFNAATTIWLRHDALDLVRAPNARLVADIRREIFYAPSVNVIGVVRGTDPKLANEYVLYSSHIDHDGVRYVVDGDSIWNGADDNASQSAAILADARAFVQHPAARPVLFIWHGAEERGLLGSRWYVNHPTVPLHDIVAVINGDLVGRNDPDSAALLGAQPPHKNSDALVSDALRANAELTHFKLDTVWDRPTHPEGWYFRSDHLPYARDGVPSLMFSTLLHPDYHTPRDNPDRIEIPKLAKMAQWMYGTGWLAANAAQRPDVIAGFKLER